MQCRSHNWIFQVQEPCIPAPPLWQYFHYSVNTLVHSTKMTSIQSENKQIGHVWKKRRQLSFCIHSNPHTWTYFRMAISKYLGLIPRPACHPSAALYPLQCSIHRSAPHPLSNTPFTSSAPSPFKRSREFLTNFDLLVYLINTLLILLKTVRYDSHQVEMYFLRTVSVHTITDRSRHTAIDYMVHNGCVFY